MKKTQSRPVKKKSPTSLWPYLIFLLLITLLAYSNSFDCPFQFDDVHSIQNKKAIQSFDLQQLWADHQGRFIPNLTFALNYRFHQTELWGYHLVNLLVHLCNSLLVFALAGAMMRTPQLRNHRFSHDARHIAFISALFFAIHPLATESVTYIVQRMASLAALFYLLTILCYILARLSEGGKSALYFGMSLFSGICALLSKENTYTLPVAIGLSEWIFFRETPLRQLLKDFRFWIVLVVLTGFGIYTFVRFQYAFKPLSPTFVNDYRTIDPQSYLLTQFTVIPKYLQLLVLPLYQNLDYEWPLYSSLWHWPVLLGLFLIIALLLLGLYLVRSNPIVSFGILFFFVTLSIESGLVPIDDLIVEHRTYLPSFGFFMVLPFGLHSLFVPQRKKFLVGLLAGLSLVLAAATWQRNKVWKTEETLLRDAFLKSPGKARAQYSMGYFYQERGRMEEAAAIYANVITLQPLYRDAYVGVINIFLALNRYPEALRYADLFIEAKADPVQSKSFFMRGQVYDRLGRKEEALRDYTQALNNNAENIQAYYNRGLLMHSVNRWEEALSDYSHALALDTAFVEAYVNRANIYRDQGRAEEAMTDYATAIRLNPKFEKAFGNRGFLLQKRNAHNEAIEDFNQAININPQYSTALTARGYSYLKINQLAAACLDLRAAAAMGNAQAQQLMSQVCPAN